MSFIILALMAVFNSTQTAFRASITQTDVLEGGRAAMGLIKSDLESMTPSFGVAMEPLASGWMFSVPVNFYVSTIATAPIHAAGSIADRQRLSAHQRAGKFFHSHAPEHDVDGRRLRGGHSSTNYFNPLYRFSMSTNVMAADPTMLFNTFLTNLPAYTGLPISPTNASMSHLMDGVVDLRVRAYDTNGLWMTNGYPILRDRYHQRNIDPDRNVLVLAPVRHWAKSDFTCSATRCRRRWKSIWACSKTARSSAPNPSRDATRLAINYLAPRRPGPRFPPARPDPQR